MNHARKPIRIRLEHLRLPPNIPYGYAPLRLYAIADRLRGGGELDQPVRVRPHPVDGWLIVEGRHRYVAALIAGVPDLLCTEVP